MNFSTAPDFSNNYLNIEVPNPDAHFDGRRTKSISIAKLWLKSPNRRQFKGIGFYPYTTDKEVNGDYNLFSGFGTKPKKGDWSLFRDHIFQIVAGGNKEHAEWLLNWMAHIVQNPGEKSKTSIVLRGGQGTGKGLFATRLGRIFGIHYLHMYKCQPLMDYHNAIDHKDPFRVCTFIINSFGVWQSFMSVPSSSDTIEHMIRHSMGNVTQMKVY